MEAGPLAELAVVRLERLGGVRVVDDRLDPRADLLHLLEVGQLHRVHQALGRHVTLAAAESDQQLADDVGPAVVDEILGLGDARHEGVEVLHPALLPARLERRRPLRVGRPVGAHVDRRRRALEDVQLLGAGAEVRHALHRGGARADDADALVGEPVEAAVGVAAGVVVVPAARVERVALERLDAGDARQLRPVQRPVRHHDEPRAHRVAAVGRDDPATVGVVPAQLGDLGLEAGVAIEVEVLADRPAVGEDLRRLGVLLLRDVADLLEQRQVDVRLDVARRARVAVPVPRAAEVAALLDDADVVDAGLAQTRAGEQPAEPAADDQDLDLVVQRLAFERLDVRVVDVARELARDLDVLLVAVVAQALVALLAVLLAQGIGIERRSWSRQCCSRAGPPNSMRTTRSAAQTRDRCGGLLP